jgi:hypothetical protein
MARQHIEKKSRVMHGYPAGAILGCDFDSAAGGRSGFGRE